VLRDSNPCPASNYNASVIDWWLIGIALTVLVGFSVPYLIAAYVGRTGINRDLFVFVLFGVGPLLAFIYGNVLIRVSVPDPHCTVECWDRIPYVLLAGLGLLAWELGLGAGCLHRYLEVRRSRTDT
jgi:hypothetical protein